LSRVADALVRAGRAEAVDDAASWERDLRAGRLLLDGVPVTRPSTVTSRPPTQEPAARQPAIKDQPVVNLPPKVKEPRADSVEAPFRSLDAIPFELASLVRALFLTPGRSQVRSALFCGVAGEATGDVAWSAAEVLAMQSGKRVAFVEDGSSCQLRSSSAGAGRVTQIGWYPPAPDVPQAQAQGSRTVGPKLKATPEAFGERVVDLFSSFDFVIADAAAPRDEDLVPLAQEVDGVVLLISEASTRRQAAEALATTLRGANVRLLGAVFRDRTYPIPPAIYSLL
jgi:hypothetical protein